MKNHGSISMDSDIAKIRDGRRLISFEKELKMIQIMDIGLLRPFNKRVIKWRRDNNRFCWAMGKDSEGFAILHFHEFSMNDGGRRYFRYEASLYLWRPIDETAMTFNIHRDHYYDEPLKTLSVGIANFEEIQFLRSEIAKGTSRFFYYTTEDFEECLANYLGAEKK